MKTYRIAVLPGDGIGREVMPPALNVLAKAASRHGFRLEQDHYAYASCDWYAQHGQMMPDDWTDDLGRADAILYGAVGWPDTVPDHVSLWGSLLAIRRQFDQYVNLRPIRLLPGVNCPLAGRRPEDIDFVVVRENTEGEYSSVGGRMYAGTDHEIVLQQTVMSRRGVDRILKFAFEVAQGRPRKMLASATKSNGIAHAMPYWDERVAEMASRHPDITVRSYHIDNLTAQFVLHPDRFDVVVGSNLFGDILSDLGPAIAGTLGLAPSGNIDPERRSPSLFEPVHGSAPDIAGQGIANPIGQIWASAMMLDHLGEPEAASDIVAAFTRVLATPGRGTRDLGGTLSTQEMGAAILAEMP
jgi:tartrate dehydrogenase/decarboxylase / D-malate dehydrogenase